MAIAFRDSNHTDGYAIAITVPAIAGAVEDDWMIMAVVLDRQQVSIDAPDWTEIGQGYDVSGGGQIVGIYKRRVTATEPSSYSVSLNFMCYYSVVLAAYSGCDLLDCFNNLTEKDNTGTSHPTATAYSNRDEVMVVPIWGVINSATAVTPPGTVTTREITSANGGSGTGYKACSAILTDKSQTSMGWSGVFTGTTGASEISRAFCVILQPPLVIPDGDLPAAPDPDQDGIALTAWPSVNADQGRRSQPSVAGRLVSTDPLWIYDRYGSYAAAYIVPPVLGPDGTIWALEAVGTGDTGGFLHAINPDGTRRLIRQITGYQTFYVPTVDQHGNIYFCAGSPSSQLNRLFCYDRAGTLVFAYSYPGIYVLMHGPVLDSSGNVYVLEYREAGFAYKSHLVSLSPAGALRWDYEFGGSATAEIVYDADTNRIYAVANVNYTSEHHLYQFDTDGNVTADLELLALLQYEGQTIYDRTCPIVQDGICYLVTCTSSSQAQLYAVDVAAGSLASRWNYLFDSGRMMTPAIDDDGTCYIWHSPDVGDVSEYAIKPDGSLKWEYIPGYNFCETPSVGVDCLAITNGGSNTITWLDKDTGEVIDTPVSVNYGYAFGSGHRQLVLGEERAYFANETQIICYQTVPTPAPPEPPGPVSLPGFDTDCD